MDQASEKNIQYLKELGTETAIEKDRTLNCVVRMLRRLEPAEKPWFKLQVILFLQFYMI
jgi:hypothetical protein